MNTSGILQSPLGFNYFARDPSFHDFMNLPKIEFIAYNYILFTEIIYNLGDFFYI